MYACQALQYERFASARAVRAWLLAHQREMSPRGWPASPRPTEPPLVVALVGASQFWLPAANETLQCAGSASFLPNFDDRSFCVRGQFASGGFTMYDAERRLLNRWFRYPHTCSISLPAESLLGNLPSSSACLKRADLIIAATPIHQFLRRPDLWKSRLLGGPGPFPIGTTYIPMFNYQVFREMPGKFEAWWTQLRKLATQFHRPRILVHYSHPFDLHVSQTFLRGLYRQPDWFQRRTVVACYEANVRDDVRKRLRDGLNATLLSVPHTTSAWTRPPGLAVRSSLNKRGRRNRVLLQGKLQRGKATAIRLRFAAEIRAAGGTCVGSRCVVGARSESKSVVSARLKATNYTLWGDELESEFCLQPPGDVLTRSHFYVSVQAGCIPVVVEGGLGSAYSEDGVTAWAWRDQVPWKDLAVPVAWPYNGSVVEILEAINAERIHQMRTALDEYANLTMFGDGSFDDAFTTLVGWLQRHPQPRVGKKRRVER